MPPFRPPASSPPPPAPVRSHQHTSPILRKPESQCRAHANRMSVTASRPAHRQGWRQPRCRIEPCPINAKTRAARGSLCRRTAHRRHAPAPSFGLPGIEVHRIKVLAASAATVRPDCTCTGMTRWRASISTPPHGRWRRAGAAPHRCGSSPNHFFPAGAPLFCMRGWKPSRSVSRSPLDGGCSTPPADRLAPAGTTPRGSNGGHCRSSDSDSGCRRSSTVRPANVCETDSMSRRFREPVKVKRPGRPSSSTLP